MVLLHTATIHAVEQPQAQVENNVEQRVETVLASMNLQQKVGQMVQAEIRSVTPKDVAKYGLGSILNGGGAFPNDNKQSKVIDWVNLAESFHKASLTKNKNNAGIPIIWGTDAVHGHNNVIGATLFPHNIGLGAAHNPQLIEDIARSTALEVSATGIDWVFAPTIAVVKDDRWGRTYEGYSDDQDLIKEYAERFVIGMQGHKADWFKEHNTIATAKHFIGDGGTWRGIDQGDTRLSLESLIAEHGQGYVAAINAGVQTVMASFNSWNGSKLHGNKTLLTDVLKHQMGFDGFVISDWNGIGQVKGCSNDNCAQAINAGVDMLMAPEDWKALIKTILKQVKSGEIAQSRIDDAVRRILRVKIRAGLFESPGPSERLKETRNTVIGSKEHRALSRQAVRESLVLLKNNDQLLPIKPQQTILVAGDGADNIGKQSGGWSISWQGRGNSNSDFPSATSIFQGISNKANMLGSKALLSVDGKYKQKPDLAVVVFGEPPYAEGQGDVKSLEYQAGAKKDLALLNKFKQQGIPVVAVLLTGRPLWTNAEINASDAFVVAWLPGTEGQGIADVLFANKDGTAAYDFKGRLSYDWPNAELDKNSADQPVADILFKRGYGLSYSKQNKNLDVLNETAVVKVTSENFTIFEQGALGVWKTYVGDSSNWAMPATGSKTISANGSLKVTAVDAVVQEDALKVTWINKGKGISQFYFQSPKSTNLSALASEEGALYMVMKVNEKPKGVVGLRMDCGYPCRGELDVTNIFKSTPQDQWFGVGVPLSCFAAKGVDMSKVDSPLVLLADKEFSITLKTAYLKTKVDKKSLLSCGT